MCGSTGAGRQLSRVLDPEVLLDDFPLEDLLNKDESYADAGVRSTHNHNYALTRASSMLHKKAVVGSYCQLLLTLQKGLYLLG